MLSNEAPGEPIDAPWCDAVWEPGGENSDSGLLKVGVRAPSAGEADPDEDSISESPSGSQDHVRIGYS